MSTLDVRINDRGFFERILTERDKIEFEREKRLNERFVAQEKAIGKAEERLDGTLKGFPQEYARRIELEQMISALDETSTVLAQKVVDSAAALAEAQASADRRLREDREKTDERVDARFKKVEDFQSKLAGIAIVAPILMSVLTALIVLQFNG